MSSGFENKVALITGAASGMGRETARRFVAQGAQVIVADINEEGGRAVEAEYGDGVRFIYCDVTKEEDIVAAVDLARSAFGGLDILFNNAATAGPEIGVLDMTGELWDRMMALLLRGPMFGIKHAAAAMRERGGGAIVNTASVAALECGWGPVAYSTGKAALLQLTRCAAAELAPLGIRVNAICPGVVATDIFAKYLGLSGQAAQNVIDMVVRNGVDVQPLRRTGMPADIAEACLYLASEQAGFVTGTHLVVDGGITIGPRHAWDPLAPTPAQTMGFTAENVEKLLKGEVP